MEPEKIAIGANVDYRIRPLNRDRLKAIEAFAGEKILDVGCGNGMYVLHLKDRYMIRGVDYQHFDAWSRQPDLFKVCQADDLDFEDNSFDTILSFEVLEHLDNPESALAEYFRVCASNVIITVPNCSLSAGLRNSGLIYNHWIDRTHRNFWEIKSIEALASAAGFEIVHSCHINNMNMGHLLAEAVGLSGRPAQYVAGFFKLIQIRKYPMTCLIVASKKSTAVVSV
jgi:SAM-dependent methyltransferase